jgi:hypothetical protein
VVPLSEEWVSEEEVKEEIEGLPEEVRELEVGEKGRRPEERPAQVQPPPQPPPQPTPPQPSYEDVLQELRRRRELVREVVEFAREVSSLSPQEASVATRLLDRILPPQTPQQPPPLPEVRPIYIEKEKPVPVAPPELQRELRETREYVASALEGVERRLVYYDEVLRRYDQILARLSEVTTSVTSVTSEIAKLRQEVEEVRRERDELLRRITEQYQVLPRARVSTPDGKVVEEYDFHPKLKAYEKQVDFAVQQLGPAIIAEIRAARADISSQVTRLVSLVEAVVTPELRRRAPRIVEEIEDRLRRLVGRVAPEEREKTLAELEQKVSQLVQASGGEQR